MLSGLSGLLATVGGKVAVTTAVAAASVGGLHAADVVDVPVLPSSDESAVVETVAGQGEGEGEGEQDGIGTADAHDGLPDQAEAGKATAEAKHEAAKTYTDAVRTWTDCVSENASARGESEEHEEPFDPHEVCGDHPSPHDFGLTGPPAQASDQGQDHSEAGRANGKPDTATTGATAADDGGTEEGEVEGEETEGGEGRDGESPGPPEGAGSQGAGQGRP